MMKIDALRILLSTTAYFQHHFDMTSTEILYDDVFLVPIEHF